MRLWRDLRAHRPALDYDAPLGFLSLVAEIVEDHVRFHMLDPGTEATAKQARAAEELIDVVRAYVK